MFSCVTPGVGLLLFKASDDNLYVAEVSAAGPAGKSSSRSPAARDLAATGGNLRANDLLLEIDGESMLGCSLKRAHAAVLGAPGSSIAFKVRRRAERRQETLLSPQTSRVLSPRTGARV
jgi:C-terminal processing protease CtpA/Prc